MPAEFDKKLLVTLPKLHPTQQFVADLSDRFIVLAAGRRWGKTRLGVYFALKEVLSDTNKKVWWIAPTYKIAEIGWRLARSLSSRLPLTTVREGERQIIFPSSGILQIRSGDRPFALRGEGLDLVVLDEFAFMKPEVWTEVLRPALSDRRGRALFISTPCGRNLFWDLYQLGLDQANTGVWRSLRYSTYDNPYISSSEIDLAKQQLPERIFMQEYMAEFMDDTGSVFRRVSLAAIAEPTTPELHTGHTVVVGVDWGKANDFTVLSAVCRECTTQVDFDRFNQIDYSLQEKRLYAMVDHWSSHTKVIVHAEENAMGPMLERLQRSGLNIFGFMTTAASKPKLIESLAVAIERGELTLLNDPVQTAELQSYTIQLNRYTNRPIYSAPPGGHDDTVIALALAWMLVENYVPPTRAVTKVRADNLFRSRSNSRRWERLI